MSLAESLPILPNKEDRWKVFEPELNLVVDKDLREWCKSILVEAPTYFWSAPASITGKYHAPDDNEVGGLVHHTKKVVYFGNELCRSFDIEESRSRVIVACLLHDIVKYGSENERSTDSTPYHYHPQLAAKFIISKTPTLTESQKEIARMVECHSGIWSSQDCQPATKEEWVVHLADYCASRQKVIMRPFPGEDFLWQPRP